MLASLEKRSVLVESLSTSRHHCGPNNHEMLPLDGRTSRSGREKSCCKPHEIGSLSLLKTITSDCC